ncbi:hypothetical protein ET445_12780 [Agromyces protaetiae]|uniref:Protein kinase domain-containing protein n=1 Tax=Agromyces protaetiae TaxID=2509455 RepID=A0A4P6FG42_9MICO|nr:hypothetical protein [Agromyces protaetiae]QAY74083.1 hypothetical protein ET445_12780 [Agromyces protaetiae]
MRRRSHPPVTPVPIDSAASAAAERIAGFRVVRRLADGDRASLHLVTDEAAGELDETGEADDAAAGAASAARLAVLRLYDAAADQHAIAVEVEAMAEGSALPRLIDLAVLPDGRTCLFVERLAGASLAQLVLTTNLMPGEAVTILAPIAVAIGALERRGLAHTRLSAADVLFDEHGRPRLIGTGALVRAADLGGEGTAWTATVRQMHESFAALIEDVAGATRPAGALAPVSSLLRERLAARPFRSCTAEIERMLFALADPLPVRSAVPVAGAAEAPRWQHAERGGGVRAPRDGRERRSRLEALGRILPRILGLGKSGGRLGVDAHEAAADATVAPASQPGPASAVVGAEFGLEPSILVAWRVRLVGALRRHRPKLLVAGLVGGGALVLLLTLVPPSDGSTSPAHADPTGLIGAPIETTGAGRSSESDAAPAADARARPSAPDDSSRTSGVVGEEDPIAEAARLLAERAECLERLDLACLDGVVDAGSTLEAADRAAIAAGQQGDAVDVEDYDLAGAHVTGTMGDAFLVEVPFAAAEREPASVLMMRTEAGWRLREIFD